MDHIFQLLLYFLVHDRVTVNFISNDDTSHTVEEYVAHSVIWQRYI